MLRKRQFQYFFCIAFSGISFTACVEAWDTADAGGTLHIPDEYAISLDTVLGHTASPVHVFSLRNLHSAPIQYDSIYLQAGTDSPFLLNVDGRTGPHIDRIRIQGRDSLFLFLQTKPNTQVHRNYVRDTLVLAHAINPQKIPVRAYLEHVQVVAEKWVWTGSTAFDNNTSYLLEKGFEIPSGETVHVPAGTHFYFSRSDTVNRISGTLHANGSPEQPIVFAGYRTDLAYRKTGGQWGGLRFESSNEESTLSHVHIRNATTALTVSGSRLHAFSCILNYSTRGIYSISSVLRLSNCLLYGHLLRTLEIHAGDTRITHCTVYANENRGASLVQLNCYIDSAGQRRDKNLQIIVVNSILYGNLDHEIHVSTSSASLLNGYFKQNVLKLTDPIRTQFQALWPALNNRVLDPLFTRPEKEDFTLTPLSPARSTSLTAEEAGYIDRAFDEDFNAQPRIHPSHLGPFANP